MNQRIARILEPMLRLLLPGRGRHRAKHVRALTRPALPAPTRREPLALMPAPPIRGEDTVLVRPYLLTSEQWDEERSRRRRKVWLAPHGIDVDPEVFVATEAAVR